MNINDIYILGAGILGCIVLVTILQISSKLDDLKKEIKKLQDK
jgi:hypothetical protein